VVKKNLSATEQLGDSPLSGFAELGGVMPGLLNSSIDSLPRALLSTLAFAMTGRLANLFPRWINENVGDDWGVSGPDLLLVGLLSRAGSMRMGEAANALDLTPGAVTRIVKNLERIGFVERRENPDDRRQNIISLTASAREQAEILVPIQDELVTKALAVLTEEEIVAFIRVAFKLAESLRTHPPKG
jgi:DNA-binding MarR family transcriptional regulator